MLNVAHWVSREDIRRGVPLCPSCKKSPRRLDGEFCGSACARWEADKNRQQPVESGSYYSSQQVAVAGSHTMASGSVAYGSANYAAAGLSYQSGGYPKAVHQSYRPPGPQPVECPPSRPVGGLPVRPVGVLLSCPQCGREYPGHRSLLP
ncbi:hypothetical protein BC827DRAFT_186376 [Russula dissimulans]|nr:hypothetical protein BC827DRAFT_186376 [Russula dissimulans]